jgi:lipoic acid synthetase
MSLALLDYVSENYPRQKTKSGVMVGLGEELEEVIEVAEDLRGVGVDMITVGQYLQPSKESNVPVERFVTPEEFERLREELVAIGFSFVACAPLVRSSYNAGEALETAENNVKK